MSWFKNDIEDIKDGGGLRGATKLHFVVYALLIGLVIYLENDRVKEKVGRAIAETVTKSANQKQDEAKEKAKVETKEIITERKSADSTQKLIDLLNRHVFIEQPLAPVPPIEGQLPDAPSATLNHSQLEGLADYQVKCRTCEAERESLATQLRAEEEKAKAWEQAAKGGSKWQRLRKAGKCLGFSALGSGIGALADRKYPARGAVIGSTVGSAGCQLF